MKIGTDAYIVPILTSANEGENKDKCDSAISSGAKICVNGLMGPGVMRRHNEGE